MNSRHHARLARQLIDACGGLDEAVRECRVGKSALSDYQNPHITAFMPADVMADLVRRSIAAPSRRSGPRPRPIACWLRRTKRFRRPLRFCRWR